MPFFESEKVKQKFQLIKHAFFWADSVTCLINPLDPKCQQELLKWDFFSREYALFCLKKKYYTVPKDRHVPRSLRTQRPHVTRIFLATG